MNRILIIDGSSRADRSMSEEANRLGRGVAITSGKPQRPSSGRKPGRCDFAASTAEQLGNHKWSRRLSACAE